MVTNSLMIFAFLKYCLGNEVDMSGVVAKMDWRQLYAFSAKQALLGFCFEGVERLGREYPDELKSNPIGQDLLMAWMGKATQIRRQNMKVNAVAGRLYRQLRSDGMRCCILKGQGNALMYPNPYCRTSGDIDVWVNASRGRITEYAKSHFGIGDDIRYHHIETTVEGVPVELHFVPCTMNNPIYNRRLQRWFVKNGDLQCGNLVDLPDGAGQVAVPTAAYNVVYQLSHLYHHFFDEGIGLRQIIDYYFVLTNTEITEHTESRLSGDKDVQSAELKRNLNGTSASDSSFSNTNNTNNTNEGDGQSARFFLNTNNACSTDMDALRHELKHLGLWKFAGAVMWVLHETLGLAEPLMIAPMDERRGRLLLAEILDGGNFGKHAAKYGHFTRQGMARKYFLKIWRNMHFVGCYPAEALSEPVFRTWHFFWRISHK